MLEPLDTLPEWTGRYPTLGWQVEAWALGEETASTPAAPVRFRVPAGRLAGAPMRLTDRQLTFVLWWYALDDTGRFVCRGGTMRHARGTGKSPLAAFLGCCELVGPTRLGWWDGDEPVGVRASMPRIQVAAVSESQCENTQQYVRAWTAKGTALQVEYDLDPGQRVVHAPGQAGAAGGKLEVITSSSATARGATPSLVIADETGEWTDSNGGSRFRAVLGDNAAKVAGSRVLECANAWTPGAGSVAEGRWDAWVSEREATVPPGRPWLMDVREAPADVDWSDPDSIREGVTAVYEPVPWQDPEQFMPTILDRYKPINESMREYGNLRVSELDSWVSAQDWDACADATLTLADGDEIVVFCDPSETDDATALVACRVSDGLVVPLWVHEPGALDANGRERGPVDPGALDQQVMLAFDRYRVLALFSDVHPMEQLVKTVWPDRYADQLVIWASTKDAVAYEMRRTQQEFAQAAELTAAEVMQRKLMHTGDSVLARHVHNAQQHYIGQYTSVKKGDRTRKIDACVAMIGARHARRLLLASKQYQRWQRRVTGSGRVIVLT